MCTKIHHPALCTSPCQSLRPQKLLQKGAKFQSCLPDLGFPPQNVNLGGTTDVRSLISQICRGRAGRCREDSDSAMGDAELVSGPGSPQWTDLKMLTILHADEVNARDISLHFVCGAVFKNKVPVSKGVLTEYGVTRPGWRTGKRQPEPRLMGQSSEHRGRQSEMRQVEGGRFGTS